VDTNNIATRGRRRKVPVDQITSIECRKCGAIKPLDDFPVCSKKKLGRHSTCRDCWNQNIRTKRRRLFDNLTCRGCGAAIETGTRRRHCRHCLAHHLQRQMNLYAGRQEAGACIHCAKSAPKDGCLSCLSCLSQMRERSLALRKARIAEGACFLCGEQATICPITRQPERANKGLMCEHCYFKQKAKQYLGSGYFWAVLRDKWLEQSGRCPYTGQAMILGETASIDHIYPSSRFPELAKDPANLEWVDDRINKMKRDLTKEEFLSLLKLITARFP
jgi:hypothetical protein